VLAGTDRQPRGMAAAGRSRIVSAQRRDAHSLGSRRSRNAVILTSAGPAICNVMGGIGALVAMIGGADLFNLYENAGACLRRSVLASLRFRPDSSSS
jgi:hypothetical protein